jgi:hypothetical protein
VPTSAPTHMPTEHPCDNGTHGCDTSSTQCEKQAADAAFVCACLEGYVVDGTSRTWCRGTPAPTSTPTNAPTAAPTGSKVVSTSE